MFPSAKRSHFALGPACLLLPQNGVPTIGEGATTMDTRNGNVSNHGHHHHQPQRPKDLAMNGEPQNKTLLQQHTTTTTTGSYDPADHEGSLPWTPEFHSDSELEMSANDEGLELESDTRQLLSDFLQLHTGIAQPGWNHKTPALSTMKRVVENLLEKHRFAYNGMINKLSVDDRGDDVTFVTAVAQSLFEDGTTNWGRVASLVAFGAVVCQYLKTKGRESCVEKVAQEISTYLLTDQRDWLIRNNAWEGFVDFFREHDPESKVRSTLMAVAGLAGIGATLAMLIR